jgi:LysR family transcriptional regulator (chromosome initiation inhibitor)
MELSNCVKEEAGRMRLIDPISLECLLAVAQEGTFRKAAQKLNVTQSAVSQRVSRLEAQMGAVLVQRVKPVSLTTAGRAVLRHARQVERVTADLRRSLAELASAKQPCEPLEIAIDSAHACSWAWPALDRVARLSKLAVTAPPPDPGRVHGGVTTNATAPAGCESRCLGELEYILAATLGYVQAQLPGGLDAAHAPSLTLLVTGRDEHVEASFMRLLRPEARTWRLCTLATSELKAKALGAGWGMAIASAASIAQALARGQLVNVCPEHVLRMPIYWHRQVAGPAVLDTLGNELAQTFAKMPRLTDRYAEGALSRADIIEYQ